MAKSVKQLGVMQYMNANHPNLMMFNDKFMPFQYKRVWFYPIASRPSTHKFNDIDRYIEFSDICLKFSKSIGYNLNDFYKEAENYGYGKCDVFACRVRNEIHYFIPTMSMLAEFPIKMFAKGDLFDMESRLNKIFDTAEGENA